MEFLTEEPLQRVYELKQENDMLVVGGGKLDVYKRQGTLLFDYMMSNCNFTYITVNSSTYAETFYTSLGFKKVG